MQLQYGKSHEKWFNYRQNMVDKKKLRKKLDAGSR
jgi:hypothetical protein